MDLLERARKSLNTSLNSRGAASGQAHALDSIACSLLHIARNIDIEPKVVNNTTTVSDDQIELVVRRLLDTVKAPETKTAKGKK